MFRNNLQATCDGTSFYIPLSCAATAVVRCAHAVRLCESIDSTRIITYLGAKVGDQPVGAALGRLLAAREVQVAQARPRLHGGVQVTQQRYLCALLASVRQVLQWSTQQARHPLKHTCQWCHTGNILLLRGAPRNTGRHYRPPHRNADHRVRSSASPCQLAAQSEARAMAAVSLTAAVDISMHGSACPLPSRTTTCCTPAPALAQQGRRRSLLQRWPARAGAGCGA